MSWITRINFERWAVFNFIVLALFGVVLRYMFCFPLPGINYLNILHAHSHFAFAGWTFIALAVLLVKALNAEKLVSFRWVLLLSLVSAFGMLISFSLQGYGAVSIAFSTLFLFVTYWFSYQIYRQVKRIDNLLLVKLTRASIWFLVISSLGPLALGALKASGNTGPIYQNSIYFYLHFQMNGWMLFAVLALIAARFFTIDNLSQTGLSFWINTFILSTIPLFFIFTLWSKPAFWVSLLAFAAAFLHALSWLVILIKLRQTNQKLPFLIRMAVFAITLKVIFQVVVCVPAIGEWTFSNRNLIIGYVHLITLGCVSPVIFSLLLADKAKSVSRFFFVIVMAYLLLLFIQPLLGIVQIIIPHFQYCLFAISFLFCILGAVALKHLPRLSSMSNIYNKEIYNP